MHHPPHMHAYARHVLLCTGQYCDSDQRAVLLYNHLPDLLDDPCRYDNPCRVQRGSTPCPGVCSSSPLLAVSPDGIWYHHGDEALLQQIGAWHLQQNQTIWVHVFHRLEE